jgi:predicted ATPase
MLGNEIFGAAERISQPARANPILHLPTQPPGTGMSLSLQSLSIRGFKSIASLEGFDPGQLTVLIGANGAGKSNFVEFFRFMRAPTTGGLQEYVRQQQGAARFFFQGPEVTPSIDVDLAFSDGFRYSVSLSASPDGSMEVSRAALLRAGRVEVEIGKPAGEAVLAGVDPHASAAAVEATMSEWTVFHFHYVGSGAPMRGPQAAGARSLAPDGSNIAAFLSHLRRDEPGHYDLVRDTVRLVAPYFDDFRLEAEGRAHEEAAMLGWTQRGTELAFLPAHLSDGTIRFVCLAAALQQPRMPPLVVIDEPELGLHPFALAIVGDLIRAASERTQVVVSTQSPALLDMFEPASVVVVNRRGGASTFDRIAPETLSGWTDDYTLGELWMKNVVEGGPAHE